MYEGMLLLDHPLLVCEERNLFSQAFFSMAMYAVFIRHDVRFTSF